MECKCVVVQGSGGAVLSSSPFGGGGGGVAGGFGSFGRSPGEPPPGRLGEDSEAAAAFQSPLDFAKAVSGPSHACIWSPVELMVN